MTIDEAIEFFRKASETEFKDKDDFINDCVVLFLEGLSPEEAIRKTRNKKISQSYEKRRFAEPIINDDGEDVSDNFYFVDPSTIEHNDGNALKEKFPEIEKLATAILLTNALRQGNPRTGCRYLRKNQKKFYRKKCGVYKDTENRIFKENNRIVDTNFRNLIRSTLFMYPKREMKEWLRYHERKKDELGLNE